MACRELRADARTLGHRGRLVTYTVDSTQLMILDEGCSVPVAVRSTVGPGHRLRVSCGREVRMVRVVSVSRKGGLVRAVVEVGDG